MPSFAPTRISKFTRASDLAWFRENSNFRQVIVSINLRVHSHMRTVSFSKLSKGCQTDVTNHFFVPTLCKFNSIFCGRNKSTSLAPSALTHSTCGKPKSMCVFFGNPPRGFTKMKPYPGSHFSSLFKNDGKKQNKTNTRNNKNKKITRKEEITYTFFFIMSFIISLQISIFSLS